jgi:hypothetical protein
MSGKPPGAALWRTSELQRPMSPSLRWGLWCATCGFRHDDEGEDEDEEEVEANASGRGKRKMKTIWKAARPYFEGSLCLSKHRREAISVSLRSTHKGACSYMKAVLLCTRTCGWLKSTATKSPRAGPSTQPFVLLHTNAAPPATQAAVHTM